MKQKGKFIISCLSGLFMAAWLFTGGCANSANNTSEAQGKPSPADSVDTRLVTANTKFSFNLFQEILKQDSGQNIFITPASVALALAMTYNGADGETREAIAKTLELKGLSPEEINRANSTLGTILENPDTTVQISIANSLWARKDFTLKPEFVRTNRDYYKAEVVDLDFSDPGAPKAINAWVSKNTGGKIDEIVNNIDPNDVLYILNTLYFKGSWQEKFDRAKTKEGMFTLLDGSQKKQPMMFQEGDYRYHQDNNFEAISLPYGKGRVSMYVFLPAGDSSLKEFYKSLNSENWEKWMSSFQEEEVNVVLPRFKVEYEAELNDALKTLGMGLAFDRVRADFGNMCADAPGVFISKVKHKAFIEVNEEGTKAAAATKVDMQLKGMPYDMVVDRPFFFAIRDDKTGTILFMGSVTDPK